MGLDPHPECCRQSRRDQLGVSDRGEVGEVRAELVPADRLGRDLDGKAGLADPASTGQGDEPAFLAQPLQCGDLVVAADDRAQCCGQIRSTQSASPPIGPEARVVGQDRVLEVAQHRTRLESEFGGQQLASPTEGGEGVGGPAVAVQRQHQLTPRAFAERIGVEECFELADALLAGAARQFGLNRLLEHDRPQLPQPLHLPRWKRTVGHILVRFAAERGTRLAQQADGITRVALGDLGAGLGDKRRDAPGVDVHVFWIELVPAAAMNDRRWAEHPAESQDGPLQGLAGGRRPTGRP